ncbi:hypothetical protein PV326_013309, partial [Microctonus aethiopoides]
MSRSSSSTDDDVVAFFILQEGEFHTIFGKLQDDDVKFYKYFRMTPEKFNQLRGISNFPLPEENTKFRQSIGAYERLTVFL